MFVGLEQFYLNLLNWIVISLYLASVHINHTRLLIVQFSSATSLLSDAFFLVSNMYPGFRALLKAVPIRTNFAAAGYSADTANAKSKVRGVALCYSVIPNH